MIQNHNNLLDAALISYIDPVTRWMTMHGPLIWLEQGYKQRLVIMSATLSALYQGVLLFIALVPIYYTQILFYLFFSCI